VILYNQKSLNPLRGEVKNIFMTYNFNVYSHFLDQNLKIKLLMVHLIRVLILGLV